jgi:ferredoxin
MPVSRTLSAWQSVPRPPSRPLAEDPKAGTVSQVFINPDECIDCGNCADLCAQNAIFPGDELPEEKAHFAENE